jgi:hypothetical protein
MVYLEDNSMMVNVKKIFFMSYPQYKKRLVISLFESFAYNVFNINVKEIFSRYMLAGKVSKELHTLSSISKVFGS